MRIGRAGSPWAMVVLVGVAFAAGGGRVAAGSAAPLTLRDVAVPMRDGVVLSADGYLPAAGGPFPVLIGRTPYDRRAAASRGGFHRRAVERGYAVVLQDVRGRYGSGGVFDPYRNEGRDGYDTIEWAAAQPWCDGRAGTFGLSYPGAVQWLAAMERPPHLRAKSPPMTFSTGRRFFYSDGVWDLSWLSWIWHSIAPDLRARGDLPGPRRPMAIRAGWARAAARMQNHLPLATLPDLREVAPFYAEWLAHPPEDPFWDFAELRGRYHRVDAAVLNLSGWYDEAYGPEGAITNFIGLVAARAGADPRAHLVLGPWVHGAGSIGQRQTGDLDFGPAAALDYGALLLDFFDQHLRGAAGAELPRVRFFVMGENRWHSADSWPPAGVRERIALLAAGDDRTQARGRLVLEPGAGPDHGPRPASSSFVSDPARPVVDPFSAFGPHDYGTLVERGDVLVFETAPLIAPLRIAGGVVAELAVSCDCPDFDLWVKLFDVWPSGAAYNLMSPGADVLRASYRDATGGGSARRSLIEPGSVVRLRFDRLFTAHRFDRGHRLRVVIAGSFFPHFSRNPQTGGSEVHEARSRPATIRVHHGDHTSLLRLPVFDQ